MSSQNTFPGANGARPIPRPTNQERPRQPSWVNPQAQGARPQQQETGWPQPAPRQPGAFEPDFGGPAPDTDYGHWGQLQTGARAGRSAAGQVPAADPYAPPDFEPYTPTRPAYGRPQPMGGEAGYHPPQWPEHTADPHGFDAGPQLSPAHVPQPPPQFSHGAASLDPAFAEPSLGQPDWRQQPELGGFDHDGYGQQQGGAELGFAQPEGGDLDPAYGEEDFEEYEDDYAPRSRRPMMIAAALVGAILVGGGMAYGFKSMTSADSDGEPPVIKSEASPSKTRPADAGGKQFPYSDTKILGRLGDGTPPASAAESQESASSDASQDERGPRKVETLVVGRDGTIQPPQPEAPPAATVAVPGTSLVNVFGSAGSQADDSSPPAASHSRRDDEAAAERPSPRSVAEAEEDDAPAKPVKPVKIATVHPASSDSAERDDAAARAAPRKPKKVARAETTATDADPDPAPITSSHGSSGYVAVLASVPESPSSRMDALKRFADLQQQYSTALAGKTPDVAEANLGAKGKYHRLIVGPPGSRQEASSVCADLKAQGYSSCWVTTY